MGNAGTAQLVGYGQVVEDRHHDFCWELGSRIELGGLENAQDAAPVARPRATRPIHGGDSWCTGDEACAIRTICGTHNTIGVCYVASGEARRIVVMLVAREVCCFGGAEALRRRCKCVVFGKQVSQVGEFGGVSFTELSKRGLQVPQHQDLLVVVPG